MSHFCSQEILANKAWQLQLLPKHAPPNPLKAQSSFFSHDCACASIYVLKNIKVIRIYGITQGPKTQNIFWTSSSIDESVENSEKKRNIFGVLPYVAPEILYGEEYTKAADSTSRFSKNEANFEQELEEMINSNSALSASEY
ncbi:hypothetical protein Glove_242g93 [Diversispora epigaea]|uniref:Protein kinase domain-containing protein n=1 Tax=Diversispora epigaea TaxID=1348612 RepID=A0A397IE43_9GLOM|nr:hypothetical protein Glove_242g93 [Diversispora epigaea]